MNIEGQDKVALIDTGAGRCCMNEEQYRSLGSPPLESQDVGFQLRTASGALMPGMGFLTCNLGIGGERYKQQFIVCRQLTPGIILGRDFLSRNQLGISWGPEGALQLRDEQDPSIQTAEEITNPTVKLAAKTVIPSRTLVLVTVLTTLPPCEEKTHFDFVPIQRNSYLGPNCIVYPLDYASIRGGLQRGLQILINLGQQDVKLQQGIVLGHYQKAPSEDIMITQEDIFGVNIGEPWAPGEVEEEVLRGNEKGFITSPADIDPREPIKLRDAEVTPEHRKAFQDLCSEFEVVFSRDSADLGKTPLLKMDIPTGDSPPVTQRPYTLALKHVQWVQEEIEVLEKAGVIAKSVSPWASPIVIVPKKTAPGEPPRRRMCVDYRMLNQLLPKVDKAHSKAKGVLTLVPLPKIDEIYAKLEGSTIYSTFDMRSGYYHLELNEESQPKSAFVVGGPKGGKWEFKRCPFGLTQAPAYFQMLVNKVLEGLEFTFGYLDDILVFSKNMEEHLLHVRMLFERLQQADLKLTKRKCNFLKAHVQYLGHYISGQGLEPIPEKLQSLQEMPPPTDLTETRKFLGFVGYYRKFIPKYSDIARPLTNLTRKDIPFEWSKACQAAFEMLKEYLLKEPILKYPKPDQPYILYTDASKYAWAGVLTQAYVYKEEGREFSIHHPITYVSGLFKGPQLNWAALTKEAYAIYMVARKLDYYLREAETTIRSYHLPLKSFLLKNTKNDKVNNWGVELASKYTLNFEYVKGVKNTLADTMSRLVYLDPDIKLVKEPEGYQFGKQIGLNDDVAETEVRLISLAPVAPVSKSGKPVDPIPDKDILQWGISPEEIIQRQKADKFCQNIRDRITKTGSHIVHPYYLEEELLMRYVEDNKQRFEVIVIPRDLSKAVLKLAHDDLGHNGSARTYMIVRRNYYWKGLRPDVVHYVKRCTICRKYNSASPKYNKGTFQAPGAPMDFISMDLIGEFHPPSTRGNKYALTVICMLSGWTWCIPIPDKTAPVVIQAYLKHVHHVFGPSRKILSDNGTEFSNKLFENVAKELGVEHKIYSPPYRPQSNGRIEGFHAFLKTCLAKHVSPNVEWDEVCSLATAAYNFLPNEHSRESPFFIMFGRDPRLPLTELFQHKLRYLGTDETILSLQALRNMYLIIAENLRKARERSGTTCPKNSPKIQQNQLVTLKVHIRKTLDPRYEGTYRVVSIKGNQVELARNGTVTPTKWAHISHVKPLLRADEIIEQLPKNNAFARKTKLALNPDKIPDLEWKRATKLNTPAS